MATTVDAETRLAFGATGGRARTPKPRRSRPSFFGISSGFPYAMIGDADHAAQARRHRQVDDRRVHVVFLAYNFKFLWALVDGVRMPVLGRLGRRRSWLILCQCC